jgi:hypothetical protein
VNTTTHPETGSMKREARGKRNPQHESLRYGWIHCRSIVAEIRIWMLDRIDGSGHNIGHKAGYINSS